jgi:transcriptional regulator of nitric oxide reductase
MPEERPSDLARAVEGVRAQRTAEQSALRNVRKELDQLQAQDARQRKVNRMLTIGAAVVLVILVFVAWRVVIGRADQQERNATPVQIPSKVDMSKKPAPRQVDAQK